MPDEVIRFFQALGSTLLWSVVSIVIVAVVFEVLEKRYKLMDEIFKENSVAAAILAREFRHRHLLYGDPDRDPLTTTTVWLARHGEVHNPGQVLYGRLPRMGLSPEGRRQAGALAEFLGTRPLEAIYSSPMLRARRTAGIVLTSQPQLQRVRIDSDLQEVHTGWQGQPLEALERINFDFYAHPFGTGDESLQMIHDRMQRWLQRVLRRHVGAEVVGVSHGDPILILAGTLAGLRLDPESIFPRPYIATGVLYRMQFDAQGGCRDVQLLVPPFSPSYLSTSSEPNDEAAA